MMRLEVPVSGYLSDGSRAKVSVSSDYGRNPETLCDDAAVLVDVPLAFQRYYPGEARAIAAALMACADDAERMGQKSCRPGT